MSSPLRSGYDPTHYPVEDDVGESLLHRNLTERLRDNIQSLAEERGDEMLVGASQFIYYRQFRATDVVAPDVYVIRGVPADTLVTAWKVWEHDGRVPDFALEVVSTDIQKDYVLSPRRYAELGIPELMVVDPGYRQHPDRLQWQVFRWLDGEFALVEATKSPRVRSNVLGCWLRVDGEGAACRVRLARDPRGDVLIPTELEAERAAKEVERTAREHAVQALRAERQQRGAEQAELAALREEVERLRRGR